jgi:hypothetical protein
LELRSFELQVTSFELPFAIPSSQLETQYSQLGKLLMAQQKKSLGSYLELGSLGASLILKNLPFVLFLSFLTIIYIANAHYAEKQVRQIQTLQSEVKELKRQYNSLKSETMFKSRLAQVGSDVESLGLRKTAGNVFRIVED